MIETGSSTPISHLEACRSQCALKFDKAVDEHFAASQFALYFGDNNDLITKLIELNDERDVPKRGSSEPLDCIWYQADGDDVAIFAGNACVANIEGGGLAKISSKPNGLPVLQPGPDRINRAWQIWDIVKAANAL